MTIMAKYVDKIALEAAREVEDEFAKGHGGGATQRRAAIQGIVARAIDKALTQAIDNLMAARSADVE